MIAPVLDRQAPQAGGFPVSGTDPTEPVTAEALLVLADGSVWPGLTAGCASSATGEVSAVGDVALVGDEGMFSGLCTASLRSHLDSARSAGRGAAVRGFLTGPGATTPIHAQVALAVLRGEIGRP
jgi:hypothetical protein